MKKIKCYECDDEITEVFAKYDIDTGDALCDDCHHDLHTECPICGEYFKRPKKPEDTRFLLNTETAKETGLDVGFYQVLEYPFFRANCCSGFESYFAGAIKLVRRCKPGEIIKYPTLYTNTIEECNIDERGGYICPNCWNYITQGEK